MQDKFHQFAQGIKDATIPIGASTSGVGLWAWLGENAGPIGACAALVGIAATVIGLYWKWQDRRAYRR